MWKKLVAGILLLTLCLTGTLLPFASVNAQGTDEITREQWLHELVTTFNLTISEDEYPDNYFPDVSEEDEYYSDIMTALVYGMIDVDAGDNMEPTAATTREFAAHTLNQQMGFQLQLEEGSTYSYSFTDSESCAYPDDDQIAVERKWIALSNGLFSPDTALTSAEKDTMLSDAKAIITNEEVDTDNENNYELNLSEEELETKTVDIPKGTIYEWVDKNTVKITDCPDELEVGNDFILHMDDIIGAYNATDVSVTDNITTITVAEAKNDNLISGIDAQGELDLSNVYIEPVEGIDIYYVEQSTGSTYSTLDRAIQAAPRAITGEKDLTGIQIKGGGKITLGPSSSVNVGFSLTNAKIVYEIDTLKAKVVIKLTGKLELNYAFEVAESDLTQSISNIKLFYMGVPGIGGFAINMKAEAKANIGGKISGVIELGVGLQNGIARGISSFKSKQHKITAEATAALGLKASLGINDVPGNVVVADVYLEAGGKASIKGEKYNDGKKPEQCTHFAAYVYAQYGLESKFKFSWYKTSFETFKVLLNEKNSPAKIVKHYEDGKQVLHCTRGKTWSDKYFTPGSSIFADSGWKGGDNSYYLDAQGKPYCIYEYELDENNNATITDYKGNMRNLTIPETIDGYPVIAIAGGVFAGNTYLCSVEIGDNITALGEKTFYNCKNLSWVDFSENLTTIPKMCFAGCSALSMVNLPDSVTTIEEGAFAECTDLASVTLPKNLETIGAHAFYNDDLLSKIHIPKSLLETETSYIPEYEMGYVYGPFYDCDGLKNVTFEEGTTKVVEGLFANCTGLESMDIPDKVTEIQESAFANCTNLTTVNFNQDLEVIGHNAFRSSGIEKAELPKSLTTIWCCAFGDCNALAEVFIPKNLVSYKTTNAFMEHTCPFGNCENLKTVRFEEGITTILDSLFNGCTGLEAIAIPDTVTEVQAGAFANCKNLKTVTFSKNLREIGHEAFTSSGIEKAELPKSLTTIWCCAFKDCANLAEVFIPKKLLTTKWSFGFSEHKGPFGNCKKLKTVNFEDGITEIANGLLKDCIGLESIQIPDGVTKVGNEAFMKDEKLTKISLPESVVSLGDNVCYECISLTEINIPKISMIPNHAFYQCTSLEGITLPDTIETIEGSAFEGSGLSSVDIPDSVKVIRNAAFCSCEQLSTVTFGNNLTTIEVNAFKQCKLLNGITLPEGLVTIGNSVFRDCDALTSIVVPDSVTDIGTYVFENCAVLKDITLGMGLTSIPNYTFSECPAIKEILVPYRVTSIGEYAFKNCTNLTKITIPKATTSIAKNAFSYPGSMTIYGVSESYAQTYADEQGITFVSNDATATEVTLSKESLTILNGKTALLSLQVTPSNFTDDVTWKSTDSNVADVDGGLVTARKAGTCTIKVMVGNASASCKVTVVQPVTSISLNRTSLELEALETYQLTATVNPTDANDKTIQWSSSDENVVKVDKNGLITAVQKGTAKITVSAQDGSGITRSCNVTVKNNAYQVTTVEELESPHNYENNCSDFWIYTAPDLSENDVMRIAFDSSTKLEEGFDYLYIYDGSGNEIGRYTGTELAGIIVSVTGNTVKIKIVSDNAGNEWGFKVTGISSGKLDQLISGTMTWEKQYGDEPFALDAKVIVGNGTLSYSSANPEVADVDDEGMVTINGTGNVGITVVAAATEDYKQSTFSVTLTVSKGEIPANAPQAEIQAGYSVKKVKDVLLPEGWSWDAKDADKTVKVGDNLTVTAEYNGEDAAFYNTLTKIVVLTKSPCIHEKTEVQNQKATSCTQEGYTGDTYCAECGELMSKGEVIPMTEHNYRIIKKTAGIGKEGLITDKCMNCNKAGNTVIKISAIQKVALSGTSYIYDGKVKNPSLTVTDAQGKVLKNGTDYTITIPVGRKDVGTYLYKVTFKGNYSGNTFLNMVIIPKQIKLSFVKSSKKSFQVKWKKLSTQCSGYQIQYSTNKKFTSGTKVKAVNSFKTTSAKIKGLKEKKKYYVRIRTFKNVSGKKYYSLWSSAKSVKIK